MIPMKTQNVVDSCLVDEIFYKINEIYMHHATFIAFLARAMHDSNTTFGDVINRNVSLSLSLSPFIALTHRKPMTKFDELCRVGIRSPRSWIVRSLAVRF